MDYKLILWLIGLVIAIIGIVLIFNKHDFGNTVFCVGTITLIVGVF